MNDTRCYNWRCSCGRRGVLCVPATEHSPDVVAANKALLAHNMTPGEPFLAHDLEIHYDGVSQEWLTAQ
jgi:hypothetical protein